MTTLNTALIVWALVSMLFLPLSSSGIEEPEEIYDESGRLIEKVSEDGTRVEIVYDESGEVVQERHPDERIVDHNRNGDSSVRE